MPRKKFVVDVSKNKSSVMDLTPQEETERDQKEASPKQPPSPAERVDMAFIGSDLAKAMLNAFYILENRVRDLEGNTRITKAQLKKWFEGQLG